MTHLLTEDLVNWRRPILMVRYFAGTNVQRMAKNFERENWQKCQKRRGRRELIDLLKADVYVTEKADDWGRYGYLQIRKGKTELQQVQPADHRLSRRNPHEVDADIEV